MTLHIFNPDHDLALAHHQPHFIAPRAARQLRHDLGFLPAAWAAAGDLVWVDDAARALCEARRLGLDGIVQFVATDRLPDVVAAVSPSALRIAPWGWNLTLCRQLAAAGVPHALLPSDAALAHMRHLSHRGWAASHLLPPLRALEGTTGQSWQIGRVEEAVEMLPKCRSIVLKAPWSSSGRGLRYVFDYEYGDRPGVSAHVAGWIANVVRRQGSAMVEPYYNKVMDFGMEFEAHADGTVEYLGLSLFDTVNGAYVGNVLDTEDRKLERLAAYLDTGLVARVQAQLLRMLPTLLRGRYAGPFGIDMMVVQGSGGFLLHPCVELNLRRTMGHVALSLTSRASGLPGTMRIAYDGSYRLCF